MSPFYFPFKSLFKLNNPTQTEDPEFFILRDRHLLSKLNCLFFNKSNQTKFNLTESEIESLNKCYVGVRAIHIGKGKIEKYSLLYKNSNGTQSTKKGAMYNKHFKTVINKQINHLKDRVLKEMNLNGEKKQKPTLNRLLRSKFNRNKILITESYFEKFHQDLMDSKDHELPIGFSVNGAVSLITSKYTANCFILGKTMVESIKSKFETKNFKSNLSLLKYKAPSSNLFKTAKILNFLN